MERESALALTAAPERRSDLFDALLVIAIFAGMGALAWGAVATPLLAPLFEIVERGHWHLLWLRPLVIWVGMGLVLMLGRTVFWLCYRPFAPASADEAPMISVVIPAYNEGAMVEVAIRSVAAADYPCERLEIIAVDDGSTDDTWRYIARAAQRFPQLVTAVRLERNQGKRAALAEGFRRARGDIVVTVDSDSE